LPAEFGDPKYLTLWKKLNPDPSDLEVRRNLVITQPLLWIARPNEIPLLQDAKNSRLTYSFYLDWGFPS